MASNTKLTVKSNSELWMDELKEYLNWWKGGVERGGGGGLQSWKFVEGVTRYPEAGGPRWEEGQGRRWRGMYSMLTDTDLLLFTLHS